MKRFVFCVTALACTVSMTSQSVDSLKTEHLQEVVVKGVRAQQNAPFAVTNLRKPQLNAFSSTGRELPMLFARTPGVMAWGENGLGTGTSYLRIRGAGDSRINVTLDGVPLNSPEDQCVFWANMNSYGAFLGSVQIQRGVGSSTNGDGAFGGSVALATATPLRTPCLELSASYGSYNTMNLGGKFSTGLLWDHLIFDGAYHETRTDGFIHGTGGRSGSYYGGLTWIGDNFQIRYKNIGNFEKTGQAWNGVTAGTNDLSIMDGTYGSSTGIRDYKDMYDLGLGRFNSLYERMVIGGDGTYATERYKMADGSLWDKTTDNFWQNHNLLTLAYDFAEHWSMTATLHYTHGYGYYREFRPDNKLKKFGLTFVDASSAELEKTDFVRRKGLYQDVSGLVGSVSYQDDRWDFIAGISGQQFYGDHFGFLTYVAHPELSKVIGTCYKYYDSGAFKTDANIYAKAAYRIAQQLDVFTDLQYRNVNYEISGINDKFYDDKAHYYNQRLDIDKHYDFFNPKAGLTWHTDVHRAYASVAMSHREPERNNFTDNGSYPAPKAERLLDYEAGYNYSGHIFRAGVNLYYMDYTDQFVQTGMKSDIGEKLTANIKDSYRMGVELQAAVDPVEWLTVEGNAAFSTNKIKDFDEVVEDWDKGTSTIHYDNSTLAFSPSTILNGLLNFHYRGWQAVWHTNFVSRQYLDNTENARRSLPCYSVSDATLNYTLKPRKVLKEAVFGLNFNNIFSRRYAASGWVYSALYASGGHDNSNRYYQIGFVPMAGFTMMGNITLRF
jgi:iron complex outermembrane receptor protein